MLLRHLSNKIRVILVTDLKDAVRRCRLSKSMIILKQEVIIITFYIKQARMTNVTQIMIN